MPSSNKKEKFTVFWHRNTIKDSAESEQRWTKTFENGLPVLETAGAQHLP